MNDKQQELLYELAGSLTALGILVKGFKTMEQQIQKCWELCISILEEEGNKVNNNDQ